METLPAAFERDLPAALEKAVVAGDLSRLTPSERMVLYREVCESLHLNPLTQPFAYIMLDGRLTLYAKRDATDQLRRLHKVSVEITDRRMEGDLYIVTARATMPDGRTDESIGAVCLTDVKAGKPLIGDRRANAIMRAESKAKRRVTLSIVGLGWLDETEVGTIAGARIVEDAMPALEGSVSAEETQEAKTARKLAALQVLREELAEWGETFDLPDETFSTTALNAVGRGVRERLEELRTIYGTPEAKRAHDAEMGNAATQDAEPFVDPFAEEE